MPRKTEIRKGGDITGRTRNMKFEDYGISDEMAIWLLSLCRINSPDIRKMVEEAADLACPDLSKYLVRSLTEGVSYISMEKSEAPVPCSQKDFYGYRRKTLARFSTLYVKYIMFGDEIDI